MICKNLIAFIDMMKGIRMIEKYVQTEKGKVVYWTSEEWSSERRTLFFFHGITGNHTLFESQFDFFKDKYNLIAWDAPGHGKSRPFIDFTMDIAVKVMREIVYQEKIESFIAIGQSFGGYFPQALMCRESDLIDAFIGIGTSPYGNHYYSKFDYFCLRQVGWLCMCFPWAVLKNAVAKSVTVTAEGYENMRKMVSEFNKKEYAKLMKIYYEALINDNQDNEMKCPVLLTRGQHDNTGKVKAYCEMWHERTGFKYEVIEAAGHNANVDNPQKMNMIIYEFINNNII